jgi:hypothetical protein
MMNQIAKKKEVVLWRRGIRLDAIRLVGEIAESLNKKLFTAKDITKIAKQKDP